MLLKDLIHSITGELIPMEHCHLRLIGFFRTLEGIATSIKCNGYSGCKPETLFKYQTFSLPFPSCQWQGAVPLVVKFKAFSLLL